MKNKIIPIILLLIWALSFSQDAQAAGKKKAKSDIRIEVVSPDGMPVGYSQVVSSSNRYCYTSDAEGTLTLSIVKGDILTVKAPGYVTKIVSTSDASEGKITVKLEACSEYGDPEHQIYTVTGNTVSERRVVGAFSKVDGKVLEQTPSTFIWDALGGRLGGLYYMKTSTAPGFEGWSGYVRAPFGGSPVVLIDGVERSTDYLEAESIESVELLKDASLKSLYGGYNTNGILYVKTKRGEAYQNGLRINAQTGVEIPDRLPKYLNSKDYTTYYNQALERDGLTAIYDPSKYGTANPLLYPDVDYYDQFLNDYMKITRVNAQLTGGTRNTRYFLDLGYQNNGGMEAYTSHPNQTNVYSVRGNVDNTIFDFITFRVGLNAAIEMRQWPRMSTQAFFGMLSGTRPNEFPITIPGSVVGSKSDVYGGTSTNQTNPLGSLVSNGYVERDFSYMQSDFALAVDLNKWVKGLTITPTVTVDVYNLYSAAKGGSYSVTELMKNAQDSITGYRTWGKDAVSTSMSRGGSSTYRSWMFNTVVNYDRTFGKSEVTAVARMFMNRQDYDGTIHSVRRENVGAMVNYTYDRQYVVDASLNAVGVPSFSDSHRWGLFPTIGAAWVLTENPFMKNVSWLDYLKLRASYGILGSTNYLGNGLVSNYYYRDEWAVGNTYGQFSSFNIIVNQNQTGNAAATFQKSHELNVGADFALAHNRVNGSVTYFRNNFTGGLVNLGDMTPGVSGKGGALQFVNYEKVYSTGVEAELSYNQRFGDFVLGVGGNFSYGLSKITKQGDVQYPDALSSLRKLTRYGDVRGYHVIGTYSDAADIASSAIQSFSKVYPGDLKYEDVNKDGLINAADEKVIGNASPEFQYGITVSLHYKGFNLDVLGYGLGGFDRMLTSSYYQITGLGKYSSVVTDGLPNGNVHPQIHAENLNNNYVDSDYWVVKGDYFKIRNLEFGYTLPHALTARFGVNTLKLFVRGHNLFTISKIDDLDPECLNCGVGEFPLCTSLTGGVTFTL